MEQLKFETTFKKLEIFKKLKNGTFGIRNILKKINSIKIVNFIEKKVS